MNHMVHGCYVSHGAKNRMHYVYLVLLDLYTKLSVVKYQCCVTMNIIHYKQ